MNIFEKYGSYEAVKQAAMNYKNSGDMVTAAGLELQCLEYRRQHNIFEVGDIAVNSRGDESRLLKIWKVDVCLTDKRMSIADYDADGLAGWSRFHCLRHATDEEIQAGKRL